MVKLTENGVYLVDGKVPLLIEIKEAYGETAVSEKLCEVLSAGDALLIKASRGVRLEEVYNTVKQHLSE